jgi:hypothetical protein
MLVATMAVVPTRILILLSVPPALTTPMLKA